MDAAPTTPPNARRGRLLRVALAALLGLFLALPLLRQTTGWPGDVKLAGVEPPVPPPRLSWRGWFDGHVAAAVEPWLQRHLGMRGTLVALANQADYSLFHRPPGRGGTSLVVGRDYWLYEREYVRHYTRRLGLRDADRDRFVGELAALQQALAARGIAFVLLIAPSKAEIVPEHLPPGVPAPPPPGVRTNAYEALLPMLRAAGVNVLDAHRLFQTWRAAGPPLFAPGGTHWNYYGAQCVTEALLDRLPAAPTRARLAGFDLRPPVGTDIDLRALLNLWRFEPPGSIRVPFPRMTAAPPPGTPPEGPALLVVGDSFSYTLLDSLARSRAVPRATLLYYFKRRFTYDWRAPADPPPDVLEHWRHDRGALDPESLDWASLLFDKQAVILEINEIQLRSLGWGFPEAARRALAAAAGPNR